MRRVVGISAAVLLTAACGHGSAASPADGQRVFQRADCATCHSVDGSPGAGPTLKGLSGRSVDLADGTTVVADDSYIRDSIQNPDARVVKGFPPGLMARGVPRASLSERDVAALVAYIKSLK
jgi:cytochrome c oxidase subunit 2